MLKPSLQNNISAVILPISGGDKGLHTFSMVLVQK